MEVILQENIKNLGRIGDTIKVKAGYARNCLIPQGKALMATAENMALVEEKRAELEKAAAELMAAAKSRAEQLDALSITISVNAGEEGKLFGSIGARDIAAAIEEAGVQVNRNEIDMPEGPIRQVGDYDIRVKLHAEVFAVVKLNIAILQEADS